MSLAQRDIFIKHIFTTMAPHLDLLSSGFSLGLDRLWRRQAIALSGIQGGAKVLDVCTGTGELAFLLSEHVGSHGSVTGSDFCEEMLERARAKREMKHQNLTFAFSDAKRLPFADRSFDAVTVSFGIRNIPDTPLALLEINRVLKPGGSFVCLELTKPHSRWFRAVYEWYVHTVMPFIGNLVVKAAAPYLYLPRSINAFYPPEEFKKIIAAAGFTRVTADSLTMGIATLYRAVKHG